jgi:hypothetical protein
MVEKSGSSRLGVAFSPNHCIVMQEDPVILADRYASGIQHVSFGDRRRVEEDLGMFDLPSSGSSSCPTAPVSRACWLAIHSDVVRHQPIAAPDELPISSHSSAVLMRKSSLSLAWSSWLTAASLRRSTSSRSGPQPVIPAARANQVRCRALDVSNWTYLPSLQRNAPEPLR